MSDSEEEENFCFFGKPLEPYDEDAFPKKRPISVEEQIATDAQGRRRFHGWTPSEFKSTRQDKAQNVTQKPEDFMDEEDVGEFGIAHQTVRATKEFSTVFANGPIPGEPVLETLLTSGNETVGYLLLRNIGIEDKIMQQTELNEPETKVYGCQMPSRYSIPKTIENKQQYRIPDIYSEFLRNPKCNSFGLGYQGLDKTHVNLFKSTNFVMKDKDNKKISIAGKAFGVGAFEEEDEDIYGREDMSNYDFELTKEKASGRQETNTSNLVFGLFKRAGTPLVFKNSFPPPTIPHSFTGIHKVRKSRFEPIEEEPTVDRKDMNPIIRARYLGEDSKQTFTQSKPSIGPPTTEVAQKSEAAKEENETKRAFDASLFLSDKFVAASKKEDVTNILEEVQKCETTHGTQQMRDAAKMKMFGLLTVTTDWYPVPFCARGLTKPDEKNKKRTKNLIFEYQKHADLSSTLKPGLSTSSNDASNDPPKTLAGDTEATITCPEIKSEVQLVQETVELEPASSGESNTVDPEVPTKDITEKIDVAARQDLFKAVFLSSSESEDEEDAKEERRTPTELFKPKQHPQEVSTSMENSDSQDRAPEVNFTAVKVETEVPLYGPRLPSRKVEISSKITLISSDSEDEWVEKSVDKKKKPKHKKKHKKEKHKKRKHDKKDKG
ncbi:hypothetical protein NQ318_006607 [Aromia moschata]|uniref:G patch domain-containing protein n=1 Tax=Aromia moschata TaxID=1265417 RepID=A0AAV8XZ67_9CUCU|nr:hypothetical protein NQ318_006607 [Aromia moschata]